MDWPQKLNTAISYNEENFSALEEADPVLALEIMSGLSQAVQRDMAQHEQFWNQHDGIITNIFKTVNDMHLKANNQTDGVSSYDRMVDLLLAEQRAAASQPLGMEIQSQIRSGNISNKSSLSAPLSPNMH